MNKYTAFIHFINIYTCFLHNKSLIVDFYYRLHIICNHLTLQNSTGPN